MANTKKAVKAINKLVGAKGKAAKGKAAPAPVAVAVAVHRAPATVPGLSYGYGPKTPRHNVASTGAAWQMVVAAINTGNATLNGITIKTAGATTAQCMATVPPLVPLHFVGYAVRRGWLVVTNAPVVK